jgi:hypothetical protein
MWGRELHSRRVALFEKVEAELRTKEIAYPKAFRNAYSFQIGQLLRDDLDLELIERTVFYAIERGYPPHRLPQAVVEVQTREEREREQGLIEGWQRLHIRRWPTGVRWVRGTHSGTYKPDPLGSDEPDYQVPGARMPTREEFLAALRAQDQTP